MAVFGDCFAIHLLLYSATMRACFSFFLAIMLSLNTAYAASVGVCDALEHSPSHAVAHFGHHSHEHSNDHIHDEPASDTGGAGNATMADHHHTHTHPGFSFILPGIIGVMPLIGSSPLIAAPASTFVSASQVLPYHPPRATLA